MKDFNFKIPQNIQFGMGSLKKLPEILAENHSDNILLVSDRGLEKIGVVKKVQEIIEAAGLKCTSYLDVVPNPTVAVVNEATALYKECGATSIVALGGGSSMDVGKAVGVLVNYGGKITDYEGNHKVPGPIVPMIAIPTTAGTGSEVTASAVITDTERNYKLSVFSYEILPKYAVLDPELIMTAPASIAASCGVDALIHAMEAYVSRNATPFSDAMAEKAMELIGGNLRRFVANRQDEEAACAMMLGSNFAGISFAWARLGNVHAMSHPVSAYFNVPHGVANSILLPHIIEYNSEINLYSRSKSSYAPCVQKYCNMARILGVNNLNEVVTVHALINQVRFMATEMHMPTSVSEALPKLTKEEYEAQISLMAKNALQDGCTATNPRIPTEDDVIELYKKIW